MPKQRLSVALNNFAREYMIKGNEQLEQDTQ